MTNSKQAMGQEVFHLSPYFTGRVPSNVQGFPEVLGRTDVALPGTEADPPDPPRSGSLLVSAQFTATTIKLGRLPPFGDVQDVSAALFNSLHVLL